MAGLDKVDPAMPCPFRSVACGRLAQDGRMGLEPCREMPARELDEEIPVAGEYPLRRRSEAMGKVRVLRS
jgi:hypothetical protein